MPKRYGICFQGSKNKIAEWIVDILPKADHLFDVFCGGGAITHCALLSGKWGCVHFSDITDSVTCVRDMLEGNIPDGSEWISREDFYKRKDSEPWIRLLWSFSNNQRDYLYSRKLEAYKKAVHEMIFAPTPTERRLKFREVCRLIPSVWGGDYTTTNHRNGFNKLPPPESGICNTSNLSRISIQDAVSRGFTPPLSATYRLEAMERIGGGYERLQAEERRKECEQHPFCYGEYEMRIADYRDIEILPNSVVYCDPPYKDTREYRNDEFDFESFYQWALEQNVPVFISEYNMDDRFKCIASKERTSTFSATNNALKKLEKIFVPNKWYDKFKPIEQKSLFDDI